MIDTVVKIKALSSDFQVPEQAHVGDACFDARTVDEGTLYPGEVKLFSLGFAAELEPGWEMQVRPRSGLAAKHGVTVLNTPGTIDAGYRGECKVMLINTSEAPFRVSKGERVCQLAIRRVPVVGFEIVDELSDTSRGEGGFGSTGVK